MTFWRPNPYPPISILFPDPDVLCKYGTLVCNSLHALREKAVIKGREHRTLLEIWRKSPAMTLD